MPGKNTYDKEIRDAIENNPVGTEQLPQQSMRSATNIDPVVDPSLTPFASRPLTKSEYDMMMQGAKNSSLNMFSQLAFAGAAPKAPGVPVPRSFAGLRAMAPAAAMPRPVERAQTMLETAPFGVPAAELADPSTDSIPTMIAKLALR